MTTWFGKAIGKLYYTASWIVEYSLSIPGSIKHACPRIRQDDAPTSQKKVMKGDESHNKGMPITKRAVYRDFWVMTWSPT